MNERKQQTANLETLADERFIIFVRKKAERMVTALYIVTDLLSDREPLKWSLRHKCITVLGDLLPRVRKALTSQDAEIVVSRVSEITSLLQIAQTTKLLSDMNSRLLYDACSELKTLLGELGEKSDLDSRLFEMTKPKGIEKNGVNKTYSSNLNDTSLKDKMSHRKKANTNNNASSSNERQKEILAFLQKQGEATMSDIKKRVGGVSDKTLQRDISIMIQKGVLAKSGSKRWTNYRIV